MSACLSLSLQSPTGSIHPQSGPQPCSVQPAGPSKPAASAGPRQPGRPDERPGRRDPERRRAQPGLAGLGLHRFPSRHLAQRRLFLLFLQPLCHGDGGHAGALPVSGPILRALTTVYTSQ